VLQTVPRTINTGLGSMFILGALTLLGGDSLTNFALALLIGLVVGTLSSVFTAAPLVVLLEKRWPLEASSKDPAPRKRPPSGRQPAAVAAGEIERDRWSSVDPYADIPSGKASRDEPL
jgi:SecD/SecF fusion protein